jgi:hypothetical protein
VFPHVSPGPGAARLQWHLGRREAAAERRVRRPGRPLWGPLGSQQNRWLIVVNNDVNCDLIVVNSDIYSDGL